MSHDALPLIYVACPACGEHNDPKYGTCWNCFRELPEARS